MSRQPRQIVMEFRTWGGRRAGAGRKPKGARAMLPHDPRPALAARFPVHVTLKVRAEVRSLRTKDKARCIRRAFAAAAREGFRITDWSIQGDHIHLMVEAQHTQALSRGVQGFSIRVAKGLNRLLGRKGSVFVDRYHARILRTPREVRNCLAYVLLNAKHHGVKLAKGRPDAFSSAWEFDGWRTPVPRDAPPLAQGPPSVATPRTWLRNVGWRRHGLLTFGERPGQGCR
jgi:REP element-mobilizing transposase RayT